MKFLSSPKNQLILAATLTLFNVTNISLAGPGREGCALIDKSNVAGSLNLHESRMKALCDAEKGILQQRDKGLFATYKKNLESCKALGEAEVKSWGHFWTGSTWNKLTHEQDLFVKRLDASCKAFKESLASADKACGAHQKDSKKVKDKSAALAKLKDKKSAEFFAQQEEIMALSETDFKDLTKGFIDSQKPINKLYGELKSQVKPAKPDPNDPILTGHVNKMEAEIKKANASLEKKMAEKKIPAAQSKALVECKQAAQFLKEVHASADKNVAAPLKRLQNELLQYSDSSGVQASDFGKKRAEVAGFRKKAESGRAVASVPGVTPGWEGIPSP